LFGDCEGRMRPGRRKSDYHSNKGVVFGVKRKENARMKSMGGRRKEGGGEKETGETQNNVCVGSVGVCRQGGGENSGSIIPCHFRHGPGK